MALIFMDGFDHYATADLLKRYTYFTNNTYSINSAYARSPSGQGLFLGPASATSIYKQFGVNYTGAIVGFAMKLSGTINNKHLLTLWDSGTEQCRLFINSSSILEVRQNTSVKATGSTVLQQNVWYYVEWKATVHGSAGVTEVHLNGVTEIAEATGLDLAGTANNYWNGFQWSLSNTGPSQFYLDDMYLLDPSTGSNTDFLGPVRIAALMPSAPGATSAWTPNGGTNYGAISELFQDGDESFNQSSTAGQVDTFEFQDLPADTGSVYAVQTVITARQDAGAARSIAPVLRPASTDRVGTTVGLSSTYLMLTECFDVNPEDSAAWEPADIASLEAGYKLIA